MLFRQIVISCAALTLLSGCSNFATNWMPHGYTYDDDTPITSAAPSQPWLNDAVITNTDDIAANTAAWQGAVYELIDKISPVLSPADGPVVLSARTPMTAQKQAFDHFLRQALIQRGYTVTTRTGPGPTIVYDVLPLEDKKTRNFALGKLGADSVPATNLENYFLLRVTTVAQPALDEAVVAVLQEEQTEYWRWPGYANQPVQGKSLEKTPVYLSRE